jgi:hypothetical protein
MPEQYDKPKVTIDLQEYNDLKEAARVRTATVESTLLEVHEKFAGVLIASRGQYNDRMLDNFCHEYNCVVSISNAHMRMHPDVTIKLKPTQP